MDYTTENILDYLKDTWKQQLALEEVCTQTTFVDQGGNSMASIRMIVGVSAHFGTDIDFEAFFDEPTIDTLAHLINKSLQEL